MRVPVAAPTDASKLLAPGDLIVDRYQIARELGRGGMGVVYLCNDRISGDRVAVKCVFLDKQKGLSNEAIWFQQEARALAALDHPSIVRARDYGSLPEGSPFLVMDALHGRSIHVWKYLTKFPWPVLHSVVDQILSALAHAHARGVIHGDMKPSNVLVDPRGALEEPRAYVLDLGLAWLLSDHIDPRLGETKPDEPAMPFGLGTPGWMAPEQIRRAAPHIGPSTDLYALGSIVFELLTGREVFTGTPTEILRQHRDSDVPPLELPKGVPEGAAAFVTKCLAKRPWHRFRIAADARAVWQTLRPEGPVRWKAPNVRVGDEEEDPVPSIRPIPSAANPSAWLTPGILQLRPTPLVGRHPERERLRDLAQAVAEGREQQRLVVLRGEAGVGKTRLAEWLFENVHETGLLTPLRARYRRTPGPFDGMRGAITAHYNLRGVSRDVIEQALLNEWEVEPNDEQGRTWVAAAAAWLRPLTPDEEARVGPSGKRFFLDKPELRWVVIRHVLERITAAGRPLLLWLDDLHLASANAFSGLVGLYRERAKLPMLYVATARDEALSADNDARERLEALSQSMPTTTLHVAPLEASVTKELLAASLPLAPEAEAAAVQRSQGNPLYALQLVHAWASGGQLALDGDQYRVPAEALARTAKTTAELFDERLELLPAELRPAAFAAAALGEVVQVDGLSKLVTRIGLDAGRAFHALSSAQILVLSRSGRLRWPHGLLQEHVEARLRASPDAQRVYALAAEVLATYPDAGSRRIVRQRARNLILAGDDAAAAKLLLGYVERSWQRGRDVGWTKADLDIVAGHVPPEHVAPYSRWRAEVARHLGNLAEARKLAEEARRAYAAHKDDPGEANCLRLLAHIASDQGVPALGRIEAVLAHAKFDALDDELGRAQTEVLLGEIEYLLGDHKSARLNLEAATRTLRARGDQLAHAQACILLAFVEQAVGRLEPSKQLLTSARADFDAIGYQLGLAQCDVAFAHALHRGLEHAAAYDLAKATLVRFTAMDNPRGEAACERLMAMSSLDRGDAQTAFQHALTAYTLYDQRLSDAWGRVEGELLLAQTALVEGAVDRAKEHLASANRVQLDESEPTQHRHLTAAWVALVEGRDDDARTEVELAEEAFPDGRRSGDHTPALLVRLVELGRETKAVRALDKLGAFREKLAAGPASSTPVPLP